MITISKMPQTFITIDEYLEFQKRKDVTYDDYEAVRSVCQLCKTGGRQRSHHGHASFIKPEAQQTPAFAAGPGPCCRSPT